MSHAVTVGSKHLESFKFVSLFWKRMFCKAVYTQNFVLQTWLWVTFTATSTTAAAELAISLESETWDKRPVC